MIKQKYGVVYTPDSLAQFVAALLKRTAESSSQIIRTVLDPSSGECALLNAAKKAFGTECAYIGIDVDQRKIHLRLFTMTQFCLKTSKGKPQIIGEENSRKLMRLSLTLRGVLKKYMTGQN